MTVMLSVGGWSLQRGHGEAAHVASLNLPSGQALPPAAELKAADTGNSGIQVQLKSTKAG